MPHDKNKIKTELVIFLIILFLASFFRLYRINTIPPGLWPDEAANGVDALKALDTGDFRIFYPNNNGREGLFINLQAASVNIFGVNPWALRTVSAIIGILTIVGFYLLTRYIFNWRTAAIASFFMAISFWHVNFSRIGFRAIMLPFILVWIFYFLWRGLRNGHLKDFFIAGLFSGIGFYTYFSFRIAPLIGIALFWNYWLFIKKDFDHSKYEHAKNQILRGFALLVVATIIIALPLLAYFYAHPGDFLKREGRSIFVFDQEQPLQEFGFSIIRTLRMFNFTGDSNQRHNIPGSPELVMPIGLFFLAGFIKELMHWIRRKHGHFSTTHTFLFTWFFIMLLPGFLSTEAPHALRVIGVLPVVMIFAAQGFWWFINLILRLYRTVDPHYRFDEVSHHREARLLVTITILTSLISVGFWEYSRYFNIWGRSYSTQYAFSQNYVEIANYLNNSAINLPKYILANEGDVLVDGVPNNAQTIKFLTRTHSPESSEHRRIYYLKAEQLYSYVFPNHYELIPLSTNKELEKFLTEKRYLNKKTYDSFSVFSK